MIRFAACLPTSANIYKYVIKNLFIKSASIYLKGGIKMFKEILENENLSTNTKGGLYYHTTYNANLDLFTLGTRFKDANKLINLFDMAYNEDKTTALAILLYNLDIRNGKGERRVFKILFNHLCKIDIEYATRNEKESRNFPTIP